MRTSTVLNVRLLRNDKGQSYFTQGRIAAAHARIIQSYSPGGANVRKDSAESSMRTSTEFAVRLLCNNEWSKSVDVKPHRAQII